MFFYLKKYIEVSFIIIFASNIRAMKSIFDYQDNQEIMDTIQKLTPAISTLWGEMSVEQILKHYHAPTSITFGDLKMKPNFTFSFLGKLFKNITLKNDLKKNSTTVAEFMVKEPPNFYEVQQELINRVKRFAKEGTFVIKNQKHRFFRTMTYEN